MIGRVVTKKMQNTVTVLVEGQSIHPLYKKAFLRSKKYIAHDPIGVKEGDLVELVKCKPISKMKHFQVVKVLGKRMEEIMDEKLKKEAEEVIAEVMPEERSEEKKKGKSENGST